MEYCHPDDSVEILDDPTYHWTVSCNTATSMEIWGDISTIADIPEFLDSISFSGYIVESQVCRVGRSGLKEQEYPMSLGVGGKKVKFTIFS